MLTRSKIWSVICGVSFALLFPIQSQAAADPLIEGAKLCTRHLPRYEREYAIPTHLLSAIASTESGRYHEGLKIKLPWPWTINANGKGYFFDSKEEAIAAVKKLRAHGVQKIDVGCMQVNLYHHAEAFSSLDQAFEPQTNIAYAASFLRNLYNEEGTWKKAAADYHSKTPSLGNEYVSTVYDSWFSIIEKLRAARLRVPESSIAGMNDLKSGPPVVRVAEATPATVPVAKPAPKYEHPRMNQIAVTSGDTVATNRVTDTPRESNILVVQPEIVTADNRPLQTPAPASQPAHISEAPDIQAVIKDPLAPAGAPQQTRRPSGPNFIFND